MSAISKDQRQRDEKNLARFLVFFNIALLGLFLVICFHQTT